MVLSALPDVSNVVNAVDTVWILVGAALVFFMQAGFAMVEVGFTRAKNSGNIIMKNLMDFALGTVVFWLLGYGLMTGNSAGGFIGTPVNPFGKLDYTNLIWATVFCATAATIVSGAMAERTRFSCYCVYSVLISLFVYPVSAHWIWGGGWLSDIAGTAFHDFAGSTVVHMVGGISALIGAKVLGPRIGKYDADGKPRAIPGHSITLGALGVFILWFGWFGFNGSSTYAAVGADAADAMGSLGHIFVTTNMAPAVAATVCMIITWIRYKKPDVSMCLNGVLAGLVGVTAGADCVTPLGSALIGLICGFVVVFGVELLDKKLKIDDPVGAIAVHGMCGLIGTLCVALFAADGNTWGLYGAITGANTWAQGFTQLGIQLLGIVCVAAWVCLMMIPAFILLKKFMGLRVSAKEEIDGLDIYEHNLQSAYAGFTIEDHTLDNTDIPAPAPTAESPATRQKPATVHENGVKMSKVTVILKETKFEALKNAMNAIGVTGMTVTKVMGCGTQKGAAQMYRGVPVEINLLPKVKVEIVVSKVPVETVVDTARKVLYSGNIGDGKIFVYDVEDVVRIRTGESGYDALQD